MGGSDTGPALFLCWPECYYDTCDRPMTHFTRTSILSFSLFAAPTSAEQKGHHTYHLGF